MELPVDSALRAALYREPTSSSAALEHNNRAVELLLKAETAASAERARLLEDAEAQLALAIALDSTYSSAQANLGFARIARSLVDRTLLDSAIMAYRNAIDRLPRFAPYHLALGIAYYELGAMDSATKAFQEAALLDPTLAEAWNQWGELLLRDGNVSAAKARFARAYQSAPNDPAVVFNLGRAWFTQGQPDSALPYLANATSQLQEDEDRYNLRTRAVFLLSRALLERKVLDDTLAACNHLRKLRGDDPFAIALNADSIELVFVEAQCAEKLSP